MEDAMFGDPFAVIKQFLPAAGWYNLALTCRRYSLAFTKNDIHNRIVDSINGRLRDMFGDHYDEYVDIMRSGNAMIAGMLITQCILGEKWADRTGRLYVLSSSMSNWDIGYFFDEMCSMVCATGFYRWTIRNMDVTCVHDVQKNIYDVATGKLHIRSIEENVYKYTCVPSRVRGCREASTLPILRDAGFKFYRSGGNAEIMNSTDLIRSHFDVIDVTKKMKNKKLHRRTERKREQYWICNQKIWAPWKGRPEAVFEVKSIPSKYNAGNLNVPSAKNLLINHCARYNCFITSIARDLEHYHCTTDSDDDDDIVLIVN